MVCQPLCKGHNGTLAQVVGEQEEDEVKEQDVGEEIGRNDKKEEEDEDGGGREGGRNNNEQYYSIHSILVLLDIYTHGYVHQY